MKPELFDIPFLYYGVKGYGLMLMIGFLTGIWWAARRAAKVKCNPDLILNVGFVALVFGVIGARAFYVIHYWERNFAGRPLADIVNVTAGGLEFYGGWLGAMIFIVLYIVSHGRPIVARALGLFWIALAVAILLLVRQAMGPRSPLPPIVFTILLIVIGFFVARELWRWSTRAGHGPPASLRLYLDIMTPSLMWGLAFGRIGCFLNGCCWGAPCVKYHVPWAVQFPCGSPAQHYQWQRCEATLPAPLLHIDPRSGVGFPIPRDLLTMSPEKRHRGEQRYQRLREEVERLKKTGGDPEAIRKKEAMLATLEKLRQEKIILPAGMSCEATSHAPFTDSMRTFGLSGSDLETLARRPENKSLPVHPAQLYASVNAMLLALLLNALFYRRKRHGVVFGVLWLLYPIARVVEEAIRADNPLDTFGLTASQFVSVVGFAFAVGWLWWLSRQPLRSPRAVAFMPPEPPRKE